MSIEPVAPVVRIQAVKREDKNLPIKKNKKKKKLILPPAENPTGQINYLA